MDFVYKRNGHFTVIYPVPKDLQAVLKCKQIWRALPARTKTTAKHYARRLVLYLDDLFLQVRLRMIDPRLVRTMVAHYALSTLKHDDDLRQGVIPMGDYGYAMATREGRQALQENLPKYTAMMTEKILDNRVADVPWITDAIEQITKLHGVTVDPNSEDYRQLLTAFGHADKVCSFIESERITGNRESELQFRMVDRWQQEYKNKPEPTITLSELLTLYGISWAKIHKERPDQIKRKLATLSRVNKYLNEYFGPEKTVNDISKRATMEFRDWLLETKSKLNESGVDKEILHITAAFNWDLDERLDGPHLCKVNPFTGLRYKAGDLRDNTRTFTDAELTKYVELLAKFHDPTNPEKTWLPLIMLHSGMRPNEVAQLHLDNIIEIKIDKENIWFFDVTISKERNQHVKRDKPRIVPIHQTLIDCGLIEYRDRLRAAGEVQLFPNCKSRERGYYNDALSIELNEIVDLISEDPKLRIYSLRAQFRNIAELRQALNAYNAHVTVGSYFDRALDDLLGHANKKGSVGDTTYRKLQHRIMGDVVKIAAMSEEISDVIKTLSF